MDQRFQAQQNARLALTSIRHDIRTSCVAPQVYSTPSSGTPLASGVSGAKVVFASACSAGVATSNVTWCADSSTGAAPFGLYRQTGTTLRLQQRRQEGRPAEDEHGLRALDHERPASSARRVVPRRRESLDHERRLHPERHGDGAELGGDTVIARTPVRRLADERGQSLVLTLLVLFILAIVLSTVIIFTSSNQRNSSYQKAAQTANSLAEAGLNNAISVLANPNNSPYLETAATSTQQPCCPTATITSPTSKTYTGGTVQWWGTLDTSSEAWTVYGTGDRAEPHRPDRGAHRQDRSRHDPGQCPQVQQLPGRRLEHRLLPLRTDPQHLRHVDRAGHQHLGPGLRRREPLHGPERDHHEAGLRRRLTSSSTTSRARSAAAPRRSTPPTSAATARCRTPAPGQSLQERARERPEQDEHLGHAALRPT